MKSILELIWDGISDFTNGEESEAESTEYLAAHPHLLRIYVGCIHQHRSSEPTPTDEGKPGRR